MMTGPYAVSDGREEMDEWTCPRCGHVCQRFKWEYAPEVRQDPFAPREGRPMPYWKNRERWAELRRRLDALQIAAFALPEGDPEGDPEE